MPSVDSDLIAFIEGKMEIASLADAHSPSDIGGRLAAVTGDDPAALIGKLYAVADYYIDSREFDKGYEFIDAFLPGGSIDPGVKGEAYLIASEFHAYRDKYEEGLANIENAREIFTKLGDVEKLLRVCTDAAGFLKRLGNFGRARKQAELGLELAKTGDYPKWEMRLQNNLGLALKDIGDNSAAIEAFRRSVDLAKKLDNPRVIAANLVNIGRLYQKIGRTEQALEFMQRALDEWRKLGNAREVARCLNNLGWILVESDPERAKDYLAESHQISVDGFFPDVEAMVHFNLGVIYKAEGKLDASGAEFEKCRAISVTMGDDEFIWRTGHQLGRLALMEGHAERAASILSDAVAKLAESRKRLVAEDRINFLADREMVFSDLVESELALVNRHRALATIQRVKGLGLYELMTGGDADTIDESDLEGIASELGTRRIVAIDYFVPADRLIVGQYSGRGGELREVPFDRKEFERAVADFADKIKAYEISEKLRAQPVRKDANLDAVLEKIYESIIAPVEDILDGAVYIAISPYGVLGRIPFPALKSGASYLVERVNTAIFPNISAVRMLSGMKPENLDGSLLSYISGEDRTLKALDAEAAAVRDGFPGRVVEIPAAELSALNSRGGDWIHYAGHASFSSFSNASGPEPRIELSDGRSIPLIEPGSKAPDVAVLSACQTALGEMKGASEMLGFARTLFASGGRCLAGALWQVADMPTAELMKDFYSELVSVGSVSSAMAGAQRRAIKRGWHPYFWAAFTVSGDMWFERNGVNGANR